MRAQGTSSTEPSTDWREVVAPDEETRFKQYAEQLAAIQAARTARFGPGRALHRKQVAALEGRVEILGDLPPHARHGLFATPASYRALVRLSNGSMDKNPDKAGDVRGFGLKVLGVSGPNALDGGPAHAQDFALIARAAFGFATVEPFVGLLVALSKGPLAVVRHLVGSYGLVGALKTMKKLAASQSAPFSGFASEAFYSAAPISVGPYAARVRLKEATTALPTRRPIDYAADLRAQLERGPLRYELQLQFYVDEGVTPIEDASDEWRAPWLSVGWLVIEPQPLEGAEAERRAAEVESRTFDPWNALAAHRPLGGVMRARKVAYFVSESARGAT